MEIHKSVCFYLLMEGCEWHWNIILHNRWDESIYTFLKLKVVDPILDPI